MMRSVLTIACIAAAAPGAGLANGNSLPPLPSWQTDAANCSWYWREGEGIGLWAKTCDFNVSAWQAAWDEGKAGFVTRNDDSATWVLRYRPSPGLTASAWTHSEKL